MEHFVTIHGELGILDIPLHFVSHFHPDHKSTYLSIFTGYVANEFARKAFGKGLFNLTYEEMIILQRIIRKYFNVFWRSLRVIYAKEIRGGELM